MCVTKYRSCAELKEQFGDKFEKIMYQANIEMLEKIENLEREKRALQGEIRVHATKSNNRYKAIKDWEKRGIKYSLEAQRYFDMLMDRIYQEKNVVHKLEIWLEKILKEMISTPANGESQIMEKTSCITVVKSVIEKVEKLKKEEKMI